MAQDKTLFFIGIILVGVGKAKKYGFVRRAQKYILIDDALYIRGVDLVL